MKKLKLPLIMLLMMALLTGCGSKTESVETKVDDQSKSVDSFYFAEEAITADGTSGVGFGFLANGKIAYPDPSGENIIVQNENGEQIKLETGYSEGIQRFGTNGVDEIYFNPLGENDDQMVVMKDTGVIQKTLTLPTLEKNMFDDVEVPAYQTQIYKLDDKLIYTNKNNAVVKLDLETAEEETMTEEYLDSYVVADNQLYGLAFDGQSRVMVIDTLTGAVEASTVIDSDAYLSNITKTSSGFAFIDFENTIHEFDMKGKLIQAYDLKKLGSRTFFSKFMPFGLAVKDDEIYLGKGNGFSISDMGEQDGAEKTASILKLTKVQGENPYSSNLETITIYTKNEDYLLKMMADDYMAKHEDVIINIVSHDELSDEDYMKKVNTEIVGGEKIDLITFDNMPVNKLASKGFFEDLSPYLNEDDTKDGYRNVLEALKVDGKLYGLPLSVDMNTLYVDNAYMNEAVEAYMNGEQDLESFVAMLKSWGEGSQDQFAIRKMSKLQLLEALLVSYSSQMVDGNGGEPLNKDLLKELLDAVEAVSSEDIMDQNMDRDTYVYNGTTGKIASEIMTNNQIYDIQYTNALFDNDYTLLPLPNGSEKGYTSGSMMMGVLSGSDNKEASVDFLKYMTLNENVQKTMAMFGKLTNSRKAFDHIRDNNERAGQAEMVFAETTRFGDRTVELKTLTNEQYTAVENYVQQISGSTVWSSEWNKIILDEVKDYYENDGDLDTMINTLNNKLYLYMNE